MIEFLKHGGVPVWRHGWKLCWNWLPARCTCKEGCKGVRYLGPRHDYWNGDIYGFSFWWFHFYLIQD